MKGLRLIAAIVMMTMLLLTMVGCDRNAPSGSSNQSDDVTNSPSKEVLISKATGKKVTGNDTVKLDISNKNQGYMCVKYLGSNEKVKLQVVKDGITYTYNLLQKGEYEIFPFTEGSGQYDINVFENISGTQYYQVYSESVTVKLEDENSPFLYPSQYINYGKDDSIIQLSREVTASSEDDLDKVEDVYHYVTKNITYDEQLAANVETDYLPNLEHILESKTGICFDYAAVMSGMLRIQHIPTKLVIGYVGEAYHAWISVYSKETGWIDGVIEFDGKSWELMDPTKAASTGDKEGYIDDDSRYNALYYY
ncbi:MAG: transglutaminase-like domain-containing protein [Anaerovoracaceae bacterium]